MCPHRQSVSELGGAVKSRERQTLMRKHVEFQEPNPQQKKVYLGVTNSSHDDAPCEICLEHD